MTSTNDALDLYEVVLDVPEWARSLARHNRGVEKRTLCGLVFADDVVNGRRLYTIVGSRTTVKRGTEEAIRLLTSDRRYKEGDIRLRRIKGQSADTAGFEEAGPVGKEDLSSCKEPFEWERYA